MVHSSLKMAIKNASRIIRLTVFSAAPFNNIIKIFTRAGHRRFTGIAKRKGCCKFIAAVKPRAQFTVSKINIANPQAAQTVFNCRQRHVFHGCLFLEDGASAPAFIISSIIWRGTGVFLNLRMLRLAAIASNMFFLRQYFRQIFNNLPQGFNGFVKRQGFAFVPYHLRQENLLFFIILIAL